ncbi:MAG: UDP-N-acetylmuramate dehydrogenase [Cyanobacteriota bacterium]|nr:UDP-N-acetylmuramate dehydrogenase [Cyanobacteriota bacterium]
MDQPQSPASPERGDPLLGREGQGLLRRDVYLAPLTTFRVGGLAEWYGEPRTLADLQQLLGWADEQGMPVTVLGAGSNLLISDSGLGGVVLNTRKLHGIRILGEGRLWAAAGEPLVKVVRLAAQQGWSGLEWGIGIPGSVGGAVVMNAGAHGWATADTLTEVTVLDDDHHLRTLSVPELAFGYRYSLLQGRSWVVTGAYFQLHPTGDPTAIWAHTQANWEQRRRSQPYDLPSCGSVFRNPQSHTAGWLIEQAGLKGHQIGRAQVAERHANFILNLDQASAMDVHHLIRHIQEQVFRQWSLLLEPEVRILGDFAGHQLLRA